MMTRKVLLALILYVASTIATAQTTIGIHALSLHVPAVSSENDVNPGIYAHFENGIVLGDYYNTLRRNSVHLGYAFDLKNISPALSAFSVTVGVLSGYQIKPAHCVRAFEVVPRGATPRIGEVCGTEGITHGYFAPMVSPSVALPAVWGVTPRLSYIPGFGFTSSVIHLSLEVPFQM